MRALQALRGGLAFLALTVNTIVWITPLLILTPCKLLFPWPAWRRGWDAVLFPLASGWIAGCNLLTGQAAGIDWEIAGREEYDPHGWYLVVANHQSWVDLMVYLHLFAGRLPFPKVFAKRQMLWLPLLGAAIVALDFPLVRRYPRAVVEKRPELLEADRRTTLVACRRAALAPTTMVSFLEGTRFTAAKHRVLQSPYRHLLRPKSGGVGLVLQSLGAKLTAIIDLTIVYCDGTPTYWDYLCGRSGRIRVDLRRLELPAELTAAAQRGSELPRAELQQWLDARWSEKDELIARLKG